MANRLDVTVTDRPHLRVVVEAAYPVGEPLEFWTRAGGDLELLFLQDGQEIVRLPARSPAVEQAARARSIPADAGHES